MHKCSPLSQTANTFGCKPILHISFCSSTSEKTVNDRTTYIMTTFYTAQWQNYTYNTYHRQLTELLKIINIQAGVFKNTEMKYPFTLKITQMRQKNNLRIILTTWKPWLNLWTEFTEWYETMFLVLRTIYNTVKVKKVLEQINNFTNTFFFYFTKTILLQNKPTYYTKL